MSRHVPRPAAAAAACLALAIVPLRVALAAGEPDVEALRTEIRQLRREYQDRIDALEARLRQLEARAAPAPATAAAPPAEDAQRPSTAVAAGVPAAPGAPSGARPPGGASPGIAAFNPAISLILQGTYARLSEDPARYAITGFALPTDVSGLRRGLQLSESELAISGNVDDRFAAFAVVSLAPDSTVEVEEAYGFMPSLSSGLVPRFGRFFSGVGYLNEQHPHAWDFVDAPLAYQAFLGGQFTQDGVQVRWVAPTDTFVELGAELGNGNAFPARARSGNGAGAAALFGHVGGDLGDSHSWRAGLSWLHTRSDQREGTQPDSVGSLVATAFSGHSNLGLADFVWKWAPHGNATRTSFKLQGEYLWRRERGDLTYDSDGALGLTQSAAYTGEARGGYLEGVYQFMRSWRFGARYDWLQRPQQQGATATLLDVGHRPQRASLMLDFTPSEFSRFRLQLSDARLQPGTRDRALLLQYILTLGAHGAHRF